MLPHVIAGPAGRRADDEAVNSSKHSLKAKSPYENHSIQYYNVLRYDEDSMEQKIAMTAQELGSGMNNAAQALVQSEDQVQIQALLEINSFGDKERQKGLSVDRKQSSIDTLLIND